MAAVAETPFKAEEKEEEERQLEDGGRNAEVQKEGVKKLVELLSKLNPSAQEFVPKNCYNKNNTSFSPNGGPLMNNNNNNNNNNSSSVLSPDAPVFVVSSDSQTHSHSFPLLYSHNSNNNHDDNNYNNNNGNGFVVDSRSYGSTANGFRRRRNNNNNNNNNSFGEGGRRRRVNHGVLKAQREDGIRRTIYVSDIDQHITEEQLAALFATCGHVVDCRVCGDPHSVLRFAFIEFADGEGARSAVALNGTILGYYPVRVLPSKTAILPVNPIFLPRSEDEREMCTRTIYCTNIDKKVSQADVRILFESMCGEVSRMRLLGDRSHSANIAFVEFVLAESAIIALNCSGMILGDLPIRVSPSKTPVRPRFPREVMH